ncbi:glutathione S-transferase 1-like [Amyelois transitella]|uniref:glutathione S-transferase 1-like n=1 Tax=Amyelois transitella TaxID=680683 RepID=UPI00067B3131|nr:glutathione S-transferase 1-like [Amyelois transitella]
MPLVLHKIDGSPPVRAVLMTLDILGLEANMIEVNTLAGETRTPEFLAKNPMHTVPLLEDGDFILSDSHAIITYLVSKYGADKRADLYANGHNARATIDQRLYFDASILFVRFREVVINILRDGGNGPTPQQAADIEEAYGILEKYLESNLFVAHDRLTLADISIVATVSTLDIWMPVTDKFPKLLDWFARMKETEFYQRANEPGLQQIKGFLQMKIDSRSS